MTEAVEDTGATTTYVPLAIHPGPNTGLWIAGWSDLYDTASSWISFIGDGEIGVKDRIGRSVSISGDTAIVPAAQPPGGVFNPAIYEVQAIECECDFENEDHYSAPLTITTSKWGDSVGTCAVIPCSPPEGVVNMASDVTACFDKFRNLAGAVLKSRADVEPNFPDGLVNISDCTFELDAFRGFAYPPAQTPPATGWPGPDGCP